MSAPEERIQLLYKIAVSKTSSEALQLLSQLPRDSEARYVAEVLHKGIQQRQQQDALPAIGTMWMVNFGGLTTPFKVVCYTDDGERIVVQGVRFRSLTTTLRKKDLLCEYVPEKSWLSKLLSRWT